MLARYVCDSLKMLHKSHSFRNEAKLVRLYLIKLKEQAHKSNLFRNCSIQYLLYNMLCNISHCR